MSVFLSDECLLGMVFRFCELSTSLPDALVNYTDDLSETYWKMLQVGTDAAYSNGLPSFMHKIYVKNAFGTFNLIG